MKGLKKTQYKYFFIVVLSIVSINAKAVKLCSLDNAMQLLEEKGKDNSYSMQFNVYDLPFLDSTIIPNIVDMWWSKGIYRPSSKIIDKYESWIPVETVYMLEAFENKYAYNKLLSCYMSIPKKTTSDTDYYNLCNNLRQYLPALLACNYDTLLPILKRDYPIWHNLLTNHNTPSNETFAIDCKNICIDLAVALCYLNEPGFDSITLVTEYGNDFSDPYEHIIGEIKFLMLKPTIKQFDQKVVGKIFILNEVPTKKTYKSAYDYLTSKSDEDLFKDVTFYSMKYGDNSFYLPVLYNKNIAIINISDRSAHGTVLIKIINGKVYRQVLRFFES